MAEASKSEIRRWIDGRRRAEARERTELARRPAAPADSVARALHLISLAAALHGWPLPRDQATTREDLRGYERWARLRTRFGGR